MVIEQYRDGRNLEACIRLHERFSVNPVGLHPWLLAQIDLPLRASVLEPGCGVGPFWAANRDHLPPGWRVTLTDLSPCMVRDAERRLAAETAQPALAPRVQARPANGPHALTRAHDASEASVGATPWQKRSRVR